MANEHRFRMRRALLNYHVRTLMRRSSLLSWLVLVVALYLSLALVLTPLQAPLRAVGLEFPALARYEAAGTVRESGTREPLSAVRVSAGGYSTVTDGDGNYRLRLAASSSQDICIVFDNAGTRVVRYVDAGPDNDIALDAWIR